jgi:predicted PurR-regulated permease PerM
VTIIDNYHDKKSLDSRTLLILLLIALLLVLAVFRPLGSVLLLALVFAVVLWPFQEWLTQKLRGHSTIAAIITVVLVVVLILGPLVWLSAFMVVEGINAVKFISETVQSEGARGLIEKLPGGTSQWMNWAIEAIESGSIKMTASLQEQMTKSGGNAAARLGGVLVAVGSLLFQGAMMLVALFFFLTNKEAIINWLDKVSPLQRGQTRELGREFVKVCKSIFVSITVTALIQALAALVGYFIASVPYPFFFFVLTFVFAFIPAIGAASVCFLTAGILLVTQHPWAALFLSIYAVFVVGLIDNIAKPWLMKDNMHMHGVVVFFALIGGLATFGPIGLLIGPLSVALFLSILRIYQRDYPEHPQEQSIDPPTLV